MRDRHIRLELDSELCTTCSRWKACLAPESCRIADNDTVKRFPRSTLEAFRDAHYGASIERPRPKRRGESLYWLLAFALLFAALSAPHWWPR